MKKFNFGSGERPDLVLLIAICIYTALVSFIAGTMAANNACRISWTGCVADWIKDYQTLIASAAVIFTVVVAKQQLDATQKQTRYTLLRSFWDQLEAIDLIEYRIVHGRGIPMYRQEFVRQNAPTSLFLLYSPIANMNSIVSEEKKTEILLCVEEEREKIHTFLA
ncbi:hypothetical protein [Brucella intermedia]|uniref:hypothetical protein n=1 Tax=Brucella intermedia TaxID=94625 RepID=UPI00165CFB07|nr:hypothetical protein [Brucella intermedia]QNQ43026.1 hypothetical protein IAR37_16370 [Brucella intermedia]